MKKMVKKQASNQPIKTQNNGTILDKEAAGGLPEDVKAYFTSRFA